MVDKIYEDADFHQSYTTTKTITSSLDLEKLKKNMKLSTTDKILDVQPQIISELRPQHQSQIDIRMSHPKQILSRGQRDRIAFEEAQLYSSITVIPEEIEIGEPDKDLYFLVKGHKMDHNIRINKLTSYFYQLKSDNKTQLTLEQFLKQFAF